MRRQYQSQGFSSLIVLALLLVISSVGALSWVILHRPDATVATAPSTSTKNPTTDAVGLPYKGVWLQSGKGGFSFAVPHGWRLVSDKTRDFVLVSAENGLQYSAEAKSNITYINGYGGDNILRFVAMMGNYDERLMQPELASPFGEVDGLSGTRYVKTYAAGEGLGIGSADAGDTQFIYSFSDGKKSYTISYFKGAAEPNRQELIEQVVRTFRFN